MRSSNNQPDTTANQPVCYLAITGASLQDLEKVFKKSIEEVIPSFIDLRNKMAALPRKQWAEFRSRLSTETLYGLTGEGGLSSLIKSPAIYVENNNNNNDTNHAVLFLLGHIYFSIRKLDCGVFVDAARAPIEIENDRAIVKSNNYFFIKFYGTAAELNALAKENGKISVIFKQAVCIEGKDVTIARDGTVTHHPATPDNFAETDFENYLESIKPPMGMWERFCKEMLKKKAREEELRRAAEAQRVFEKFLRPDPLYSLHSLGDFLDQDATNITTPGVSQLGFLAQHAQANFQEMLAPDDNNEPKKNTLTRGL